MSDKIEVIAALTGELAFVRREHRPSELRLNGKRLTDLLPDWQRTARAVPTRTFPINETYGEVEIVILRRTATRAQADQTTTGTPSGGSADAINPIPGPPPHPVGDDAK